ncbi:hypothetical protein LJB42_001592 [Komagataella kurtzmanii]|nr:hypothetical protein LJB42_001592 [Komagataella kurtzmanii]
MKNIGSFTRNRVDSMVSECSSASSIHDQLVNENDYAVFGGVGNASIPSSISSFHYTYVNNGDTDVPLQSLDGNIRRASSIERNSRRSSSVDLQDRAKFRFFDVDDIQNAHGSSTMDSGDFEIDYDPHWNQDDGKHENEGQRRFLNQAESRTTLEERVRLLASNDMTSDYGSGSLETHSANPPENKTDASKHDVYFSDFPAITSFQRFYIAEQDLVVGIAGYRSNFYKISGCYVFYAITLGLGYLILRWFPKYQVSFSGDACPLAKSDWYVVETEYGELEILKPKRIWYNKPLSTFLNLKESEGDGQTDSSQDVLDEFVGSEHDPIVPVLITLHYRYLTLIYSPMEDLFKTNRNWSDDCWKSIDLVENGLSYDVVTERQTVFGPNSLDIQEKSVGGLLMDEVLHPFYIFQIFSIILWLLDDYYYYASCIFIISTLSIIQTLIETKKTMKRLRDMSHSECEVRVWRNGFWKEINSRDLVPGDIMEVDQFNSFPCDAILISGSIIVNESMLTGESVPVSKKPIPLDCMQVLVHELKKQKISSTLSRSFLYCGTRIVKSSRLKLDQPAMALAVRIGFNTTKGSLVRSMLFPKPVGFKLYNDSFKYIGFMALTAMFGFIYSILNFLKLRLDRGVIILRALDIITIVVPPALPATLTIGISIALSRLQKRKVFCISPARINIAGQLNILCFDKTGTLTEDGLGILGVHVVSSDVNFGAMIKTGDELHRMGIERSRKNFLLLTSMATCHSLHNVDEELVGDPLDFKMFEFTGCKLIDDINDPFLKKFQNQLEENVTLCKIDDTKEAIVLKQFDFVSDLRRMSVVVTLLDTEECFSLVKGAPEIIITLCRQESLPSNYEELLDHYTHNGYRVIAIAAKRLCTSIDELLLKNILKNRSIVEAELEFLGFIIFENKLKSSTTSTLQLLHEANLRTVMCTGDNILTAISVGRECEILRSKSKLFVPQLIESEEGTDGLDVLWRDINDSESILDSTTLVPLERNFDDYQLAVTGDVFKYLLTSNSISESTLEKMLIKTGVFARMSPDEKHELVEQLQKLDYSVGFCGDGANDCGALKAADIGISLSEAEASVAAPFTSQNFEISCVLDVIKEGRASLVTSFSCFQFMSLYSAIQFITVSIMYHRGSNLGDFQFLYIDLLLILPLAIFMSWSKPYHLVSKKRPSANLVSPKILISLLGNILILLAFQLTVWRLVQLQPWYIQPVPGNDDNVQSSENSVLFEYSNYQYILVSVVLTAGPPYREPVNDNKPYIWNVMLAAICSTVIMFIPSSSYLGNLLQLTDISVSFALFIVVFGGINFITLYIANRIFFPCISQCYKRYFRKGKSSKKFKILEKEFKYCQV